MTMKTLLQFIFLIAIIALSCSNFSPDKELPLQEIPQTTPCPIDTCQNITIELGMPGYNYSAPFTCYEWTDWGTGLKVDWTNGGRVLFFTFPNHRICNTQFRICAEEVCNCIWQPIESCPKNNTLTAVLDSCLFGQPTLFLDLFLQDQ